jgi:hypothetical protein
MPLLGGGGQNGGARAIRAPSFEDGAVMRKRAERGLFEQLLLEELRGASAFSIICIPRLTVATRQSCKCGPWIGEPWSSPSAWAWRTGAVALAILCAVIGSMVILLDMLLFGCWCSGERPQNLASGVSIRSFGGNGGSPCCSSSFISACAVLSPTAASTTGPTLNADPIAGSRRPTYSRGPFIRSVQILRICIVQNVL